jgi:dienelactone hydrolase
VLNVRYYGVDMAHVVVLHHALGLTDGVRRFADRLRADVADAAGAEGTAGAAGSVAREVHTPDLFDGATFATVEEGVAHAQRVGMSELITRGVGAVPPGPVPLVVVGLSLGVLAAQTVAQQRSGVLGAVLVSACLPHRSIGDGWPTGVPVEVHAAEGDPWFNDGGDRTASEELVASTQDATLTLHPGTAHLFVDDTQPGFDPVATAAVVAAVEAMLRPAVPTAGRPHG